jgi:hypothetical protein
MLKYIVFHQTPVKVFLKNSAQRRKIMLKVRFFLNEPNGKP